MNLAPFLLASLGLAASASAYVTMAPLDLGPARMTDARVIFVVPARTEQERAIEMAEVSVKVRLLGPLAETTATLLLRNPNGRDMEGELSFPLPPDATIQGYALDVNGKMVDGVPVPKQKARVAFEEEQRKGVDPGLAEWSGGNCFKTRISPIPAHGQRTITLRYTSLVQRNAAGAFYRLPLDFDKVGTFKLRVEALTTQQPQAQAASLGKLSFAPWQNYHVLEREWKELALKEDLVIELPPGVAEAPAVEKHGESFYLASLIPAPKVQQSTLPRPGYIDLIWDSSASMEKVDKEPVFEALRLYFEQNPDCIVRLTTFRNEVCPAPEWSDHAKLLEALKAKRYDGATTELPLELAQEQALCLLVTDGHINFADKLATAQPGKGKIYAFVASSGTDLAALRRWGAIPIDLLSKTPQEAMNSIPSVQLAGVELDGKAWEGALTNAPDGVVDGQVLLTGTLPAGRHEVCVIFRTAEGEKRVSFSVDTEGAAEGSMNRSFLAQNKLAALLLEPEGSERSEKLRRLGEEYGVVTPGTSLLVLENMEQYLEHDVRPPACCPELRAQYDALIAQRRKENEQRQQQELRWQKEGTLAERRELLLWQGRDFAATAERPAPVPSAPYAGQRPQPATPGQPLSEQDAAEVARLTALAQNYYEHGQYDEAYEAYNRVIQLDPYHNAARWGQEAVARRRAGYYREAHHSSRARALAEADAQWEEPAAEPAPAPAVAPSVVVCSGNAPVPMAAVTIADADMEEGGTGLAITMENASAQPTVRMQAWNSHAPYLAAIKASSNDVEAYYEQRRQYAASPGFYLDCADYFEQSGQRSMAVQVLSNLLEMDLENRSLMRAAAYKLRYMGETEKALILFRKVQELFPEEPQSHRDLALALADAGRWQEAVDSLRLVLDKKMSERFHGVEQIALMELGNILARAEREGKPVNTDGLAAELVKPVEADLRVVINWDTDMSDMDLWVTDPRGEKCYYAHKRTATGGRISRDVTQGYGPEEFLIRKALPGDYKVEAHYYGSASMKMLAPVTLYAELYTDYGRPTEKRQTLVFRLGARNEVVHIADISHKPGPAAPTTRDYQVRAGETWESIARKELGDPARAAEIIALNPGAKAEVPPATGSIICLPKH